MLFRSIKVRIIIGIITVGIIEGVGVVFSGAVLSKECVGGWLKAVYVNFRHLSKILEYLSDFGFKAGSLRLLKFQIREIGRNL